MNFILLTTGAKMALTVLEVEQTNLVIYEAEQTTLVIHELIG